MSDFNSPYSVEGLKVLFNMLYWSMLFVSTLFKALDIEHRSYIFVLLCDDMKYLLQEDIESYLLENDSNF